VLFISGWVSGVTDHERLGGLRWEFLPKPFVSDSLVEAAWRLLGLGEHSKKSSRVQ
jgi:hypothetical protein